MKHETNLYVMERLRSVGVSASPQHAAQPWQYDKGILVHFKGLIISTFSQQSVHVTVKPSTGLQTGWS